jgi:hypothetical protein
MKLITAFLLGLTIGVSSTIAYYELLNDSSDEEQSAALILVGLTQVENYDRLQL